jgi:hypothetical protein
MIIGPGQFVTVAVSRLQEWQESSRASMSQAMGIYLRGCADVLMARTPLNALTEFHKMQRALLGQSADIFAANAGFSCEQSNELPRPADRIRAKSHQIDPAS